MNCMLMRELPLKNIIRMWDTYMSESDGFSEFHLYVCAAFLVKWSVQLKGMEFQVQNGRDVCDRFKGWYLCRDIGYYDAFAVTSDIQLDWQGNWDASFRGVHVEKSLSWLSKSSSEIVSFVVTRKEVQNKKEAVAIFLVWHTLFELVVRVA